MNEEIMRKFKINMRLDACFNSINEISTAAYEYMIGENKINEVDNEKQRLNKIYREEQEKLKVIPGYYGEHATCRKLTTDEAMEKIKNGEAYIINVK